MFFWYIKADRTPQYCGDKDQLKFQFLSRRPLNPKFLLLLFQFHLFLLNSALLPPTNQTLDRSPILLNFLLFGLRQPGNIKIATNFVQSIVTNRMIFYSSNITLEWAIELDMHAPLSREIMNSGRKSYRKKWTECFAFCPPIFSDICADNSQIGE